MSLTEPESKRKSLFIMVGEISADRHIARLIPHLRKAAPDLNIWGVGGSMMAQAGVETLYNCEEFSFIGIGTPRQYQFLYQLKKKLVDEIKVRKPDVVLLVDSGSFNLALSKELRKNLPTLPILYFIAPQIWGSRPWRINTIARNVTKVLLIFPFEEAIYKKRGIPARFVGHPLLKNLPTKEQLGSKADFCSAHQLDPDKPIVAVFAGSRVGEIKSFMPIVFDAIKLLKQERPTIQFVISQATEPISVIIDQQLKESGMNKLLDSGVRVVKTNETYQLMHASDIVWAKSGTTTLEATLFGKPMLVFYRAPWLTYFLFCLLKQVNRVSWPNLLAGEDLVPELIQLDYQAGQLVRYTRDLLDVPGMRERISNRLLTLRDQLGQGDYAENVAEEILTVIQPTPVQVTSG